MKNENRQARIEGIDDASELKPVVLARVSEVTGTAGDSGGDRDNIVWGLEN